MRAYALLFVLLALPVHARETLSAARAATPDAPAVAVRLVGPLTRANGVEGGALLGASLGRRSWAGWEVEVGALGGATLRGKTVALWGRGGYAFGLEPEARWDVCVPLHLGLRYAREEGDAENEWASGVSHRVGLDALLGLEGLYRGDEWALSARLGLSAFAPFFYQDGLDPLRVESGFGGDQDLLFGFEALPLGWDFSVGILF